MDRSNLKDQEKPPTAPPRPHHSITTGPTQLPPSPNTRQPAQPSAVTASPTIRPSPQATPKDTSHLELVLEGGDLVDAALMAPAFELGVEERGQDLLRQADADHAGTHR